MPNTCQSPQRHEGTENQRPVLRREEIQGAQHRMSGHTMQCERRGAGQRRQPCLQDKGTSQKSRKPREEAGWGQRWRTRQARDGYRLWPPSPSNAPSPTSRRTNTPRLIAGILLPHLPTPWDVPGPLASLTRPAQPFRVPSKSGPHQQVFLRAAQPTLLASFLPCEITVGPQGNTR